MYESEATLFSRKTTGSEREIISTCASDLLLSFTQELYKTEANRKSVPASAGGSQITNLHESLFDGTAVRGEQGVQQAGLHRAGW